MKLIQNAALAGLGLASAALASLASFSPLSTDSPVYKVGIPSGSSISSSATGPIYFSLSAPSSYQWIGLGIGSQMAGAHIFVMYADGKGNVTISARDGGPGHVLPIFNSTLSQGVTLLAGSGDDGTTMTANVRCTTCQLDSSADSASSPWISAWNAGSALDTTSTSATIQQHGPNNMAQFTFDLSQASLSSDSNPFLAAASSPSGTSGGSGSTPTTSGSGATNTGSSGSSSSSSVTGGASLKTTLDKAHGIIMGVTVTMLFPLGAMSMRIIGSPMLHAALQILAMVALIAGFGLGIKLAQLTHRLYEFDGKTHTIFGTVIVGLFVIQPFFGVLHHNFYKKYQARSTISHTHIWFGRIIMILGVINGGLGLRLAANTKNGKIAYGVVAGVMALVYAVIVVFKRKKTETRWMWNKESHSEVEMERRS